MNKYFLPYDIYERHKKVAQFVSNNETVLDIGGELNHLTQFCSPKKIIVANLNTGDVIITKDKIPFSHHSFDVVCSIDVLEHIPKNKRANFINNLVAIARKRVILSFPIGTKEHNEYEKKMELFLKKQSFSVTYLKEHIRYGLPQKEEIEEIVKNSKSLMVYSGNIKLNELLFKIFIFDPKIKYVRRAVYVLKNVFNLITNYFLYLFLNQKPFSRSINRAYLIIYK
ncbi:MAG: hypothetical protein AAB512_01670 [Patescibacteria group bacterium]